MNIIKSTVGHNQYNVTWPDNPNEMVYHGIGIWEAASLFAVGQEFLG